MEKKNFYCARFYITYRCNSRCVYCNVWRDPAYRSRELPVSLAKRLLDQLYGRGVRYIDFTGGEPTLYEGLEELIRYASELGIKTEFTSNGVFADTRQRERILRLARAVDKCNISLDTLDPETYRRLRGIDGCGKAMESIEAIAAFRPVKIMTVVTNENIRELDHMVRYAQETGASLYLSPVFQYFDQGGEDGGTPDIRPILERTFEPNTVVFLHFMKFFEESPGKCFPPCSANRRTLTIAPDGALMLPCYHALHEKADWNGSLDQALASPVFERYGHLSGRLDCCRGCTVIPYMGISFSYAPDRYFLLQSYSEKLNHLKRDYTDQLRERLHPDRERLLVQMEELIELAWSLEGWFAETIPEGGDCWQLTDAPHYFFDKIAGCVYPFLEQAYREGRLAEDRYLAVLEDAMEFQLRLWKFYINETMDTGKKIDPQPERRWLLLYLNGLLADVGRLGGKEVCGAVREVLGLVK